MSETPIRASGTAELVLEPQIRKFADRRWLLGGLAIPLLALVAYAAVVRLSALEQMLVVDASHATRAVLYELPRGNTLAAPLDPGTQIIRLAMHGYRRNGDLPLGNRKTSLHVVAHGDGGERVEDVVVDVPGQSTRVTSDEAGLAVGDPVGVDFDVHDLGAGELSVRLTEIDQADGLLVRMYRREELSADKAASRDNVLDRTRKNHLARWTWEIAWDDSSAAEQEEILSDRWRRVGALRGAGHDLRSVVVALVPRPPETRVSRKDDSLGGITLRGDERLAFVLGPQATVHATSDLATSLRAVIRDDHGGVRTLLAPGDLVLTGLSDGEESVEISADRDVLVDVRAADGRSVTWFGYAQAWRATFDLPVVVESPDSDRLLRVTARRPLDRDDGRTVSVEAVVDVTGPLPGLPLRRTLRALRVRSRFDRYEAFDPTDAPTDRFTFYVAIPRGGSATIKPTGTEALDLSLAELDDAVASEPLAARAFDEPPPPVESEGQVTWNGFKARRPSNAEAFALPRRPVVRVARHFIESAPPRSAPSLVRFTRPRRPRVEDEGLSFDEVGPGFQATSVPSSPALVPMRLLGAPGTKLDLRLISSRPERATYPLRAGVFERVTLPRTVTIGPGPTRATLVLGDDVPPGPVTLEIVPERNAGQTASAPSPAVFVHLPWVARHPSAPRWIAGQYEE